MAERDLPAGVPADFGQAVESLRAAWLRPQVHLSEVPAPQRIAPHALALSGEVLDGEDELASGRFVLLHDPAGQAAWQGTLRAVTFVRAELEPELATDPMLDEVAWTWLVDALTAQGADYRELGGTVTRVLSDSHGTLSDCPPSGELEVRASWTPTGLELGTHLQGWAALLGTVAGLPPVPDGVLPLRRSIG